MYILTKSIFLFFICLNIFATENLGSIEHPIVIAMVPGQDTIVLNENGKLIQNFLENDLKLHFKLVIPSNFVAVVESIGTKRVDIALMNTFGYILASAKYKARARLIGVFKKNAEYYGQIIARYDGPKSMKELNGKTFAFVDPASTSGYILADKALKDENIKLKSTVFAGKHDAVISMIYQGRVDAGATYHSLAVDGVPQDARTLVKTQYPDVFEKIKILKITGPIPSDPIVFGAHFPIDLQEKIAQSLKKFIATPIGKNAFINTYHLDDLKDASDKDWDLFRKILKDMGKSPDDFINKK